MKVVESYGAHLAHYRQSAYIRSMKQYQDLYRRSLDDADTFWAEQAKKYLSWYEPWSSVLRYDFQEAEIQWFGGGVLNATYNCLDRHQHRLKNRVAYYWEGDNPDESRVVTYLELYREVNKFAAVLKSRDVRKGDRVIIYMPMIVELAVAMLACARIGAVHSVVFGGFSAESLANRIRDCAAKVVVTVDGGYRGGKELALKKNVDQALRQLAQVETVIVVSRCKAAIRLDGKKEIWWHQAMADSSLPDYVEPERMDAEDPLFILYTSGSTGMPKGVVHTHGGYLVFSAMTTQLVFDLKEEETFWCTADIGWITGHTYSLKSCTIVLRALEAECVMNVRKS